MTTDYVRGVDVSQYQGEIDWAVVRNSGVEFAFIRATSGLLLDRWFLTNWDRAGAVGIARGAYHYLYPEEVPQQARNFYKMLPEYTSALEPVLDVENDGLTADHVLDFLLQWRCSKSIPLTIYTSVGMWARIAGKGQLWARDHRLWVAHWGVQKPTLPDPWDDWEFWQHTDKGSVPGIKGNVDLDWWKKHADT